ncbi:MAG: TonB-dependent receptor [Geobacteraceae bacterium]|nr:TonB-dependent receptor [Geobacteraceae bacterium]
MTRRFFSKIRFFLSYALILLAWPHSPLLAAPDGDLQTLEMFYEGKDLVVSATRNPKPLSQTAENITIITAADIELMGAHTLPDILNNVPGLQTDDRGSVGTFSGVSIQGASQFHILFLLDGVTLNFLGDNITDIAAIPVQNIERIEIVKGSGSSSWGSALGGVINIVTKPPIDDRRLGGTIAASGGEKLTRDARGEVSGTIDRLGYYLYAGHIASDGLSPHTALDFNNLYTKLRWELPHRGNLLFTLAYTRQSVEEGAVKLIMEDGTISELSLDDRKRYLLSTLSLNHPFNDNTDLDLSFRTTSKRFASLALLGGEPLPDTITHEYTYGGSAKVTWRGGINSLAVGADFDHVNYEIDDFINLKSDKWGIFLNDTLTFGELAITPGIRFDQLHQVGNFTSPSLGIAWNFNDKTILRAYGARGYSLPVILPDSTQEKVITVQAGIETTHIPYLWLKTTLFRNYLSDVGTEKQQKQGVEVEARTVSLFNTSLSAGYTFVDAKNRETGEELRNIPRQIMKLGLRYDDRRFLRGSLLGRYVWWNGSPGNATKDKAIIWDLNLANRVFTVRDNSVELFFSVHNLFNGAQFNSADGFENARRWVEGGIRFDF